MTNFEPGHKTCLVGIRNGRLIDIFNPQPDDITIEDIAHALSNQCRFGGHVRRFYSLAEHSINVANLCGAGNKLWALLHDANKAYLCDVVTPVKKLMPEYARIEKTLQNAICVKFGLSTDIPEEVHKADMVMLATEISDYIGADPVAWNVHESPLSRRLQRPLRPLDAMNEFLDYFHEITGGE